MKDSGGAGGAAAARHAVPPSARSCCCRSTLTAAWRSLLLPLLGAGAVQVPSERVHLLEGPVEQLGTLDLEDISWIHAPGHTPGHTIYINTGNNTFNTVLGGDALSLMLPSLALFSNASAAAADPRASASQGPGVPAAFQGGGARRALECLQMASCPPPLRPTNTHLHCRRADCGCSAPHRLPAGTGAASQLPLHLPSAAVSGVCGWGGVGWNTSDETLALGVWSAQHARGPGTPCAARLLPA